MNDSLDPAPPARLPRLALLEVLDADGRALHGHDVQAWPLHLGRAIDNEVVLHDPHAAARHARLDRDALGRVWLTVGQSRNGVRLDRPEGQRRLAAGEAIELPPLAVWHIGHSTLRLRLPEDALPEELTMAALRPPPSRKLPAALLGLGLAWQAGSLWLSGNPSTPWESYLLQSLALVSTLVVWVALWALVSKLFTQRLTVHAHLRVALGWTLSGLALDAGLALLSYAFDWPWASRLREPLGVLMGAGMVAHHLSLVTPGRIRTLQVLMGSITALVVAGQIGLNLQRRDRPFAELYASTLAPPELRIARGTSAAAFAEALRPLEAPLIERAREQARLEPEP